MSRDPKTRDTRPERILLHLARRDGDWSGRAVRFGSGEEYRFTGLSDLMAWIGGRSAGSSDAEEASHASSPAVVDPPGSGTPASGPGAPGSVSGDQPA
jgi:hypothetical protein